jgi:AraC family transcriptional regulator, regulatory protein of adaptative response / DNA-3-methyladenine glycosylase II
VPELVPAHQPYDARRLLWFLGLHATPGLESYVDEPGVVTYARVLRLPGGPGVVRLRLVGEVLTADLSLSHAGDEPAAMGQLTHLLDLDGDPGPAEAHLAGDPLLEVPARPGLRVPGSVDHVETLVGTLIGQQISVSAARTVTGRLVRDFGEPLPRKLIGDGLTHAFPTAQSLAAVDPTVLPMPRARGRSLVAMAEAVVAHGESLVSGAPDMEPALLALPGVGPWTAAYQSLRAGRDPDAFMPTDLAVRRALERHGVPADPAAARARAASWSPYRALALMHLWFAYLECRRAGSD